MRRRRSGRRVRFFFFVGVGALLWFGWGGGRTQGMLGQYQSRLDRLLVSVELTTSRVSGSSMGRAVVWEAVASRPAQAMSDWRILEVLVRVD